MEFMDVDLDLGDDLRLHPLAVGDAALLAEATSGEKAPSLCGAHLAGPYSLGDAQAALAAWDPAEGGQFSLGILRGQRLVGGWVDAGQPGEYRAGVLGAAGGARPGCRLPCGGRRDAVGPSRARRSRDLAGDRARQRALITARPA